MQDKKVQKIVDGIITRASEMCFTTDVALEDEQLRLLEDLNRYCVSHVLSDFEVTRDPRKLPYMSAQEMKYALIAICLAQTLIDPLRKRSEGKEFYDENIVISTVDENMKLISFGKIRPEIVKEGIYWDIIEDWKIYRDKMGHGIRSLIDEKTNLVGLDNYKSGGDPLYEFSRFNRKYTEKERKKEEKARESAQETFRNAMIQTVAVEAAKQQLLSGKNPMEIVDLLFAPSNNRREIKKIASQKVDPLIEQSITLLLEDSTKK